MRIGGGGEGGEFCLQNHLLRRNIIKWKSLRSSTDSKMSSHFLKLVFREEKNTNMNAIQHATQPMIQSTQ